MIPFKQWIKGRRIAKRMSLPELSTRSHTSLNMLERIEMGNRWPSEDTAARVFAVLGLDRKAGIERLRRERSRSLFYRGPRPEGD